MRAFLLSELRVLPGVLSFLFFAEDLVHGFAFAAVFFTVFGWRRESLVTSKFTKSEGLGKTYSQL